MALLLGPREFKDECSVLVRRRFWVPQALAYGPHGYRACLVQ